MHKCIPFILSICLATALSSSFAQKASNTKSNDTLSSDLLSGLKFRCIGPAFTSGRVVDFAVNPKDHNQYYVAAACGGVWKTNNAGNTWIPVFENEKSFSIGCITIDPNNVNTIWVGTGENNSQRSVSFGDGIYRSDDGGKSWKNKGLKKSEHIAKIIVDPRNSDVVFVACQGPLWGPGGDRGLYKTTDGGKTWKAVLSISDNTGITDLVVDPHNPDIMYAASYQRRRHVFTLINGGPESTIYKSTDGGNTWIKASNGLPSTDMGRIGLAISPVNPDKLFAIIECDSDNQGIYCSTDKAASWSKQSNFMSSNAQYYNEIFCDPVNENKLFSLSTITEYSLDNGKTFQPLGNKNRHVDDHALWIDPTNTKHILIGCDGGVYETFDFAENWDFKANLPITQFYRISADNSSPFYYVYGGTQDNNSMGGPSQTSNGSGILNSDWFITNGGDGYETVIDPEDPNTVYAQSQYGYLVRYDRKTGERIAIQPQEHKNEMPYRWNWDSPVIISPHSHTRLYFAANKLFKSNDKGNTWQVISEDLTRQIDRNKLPVMGKVWSIDAVAKNVSTSLFGNCISISESPKKEGLIYVGTDDGLINRTSDGGKTWNKFEKFPGIPETTYVSCVYASQHDENTVYASFDNHKNNDFNPYILKSTDAGNTWTSIRGNIPEQEIIYTIAEDFVDPNLLFIGTEFGVYFTNDGGKFWLKLKSGLPSIAVRDIAIQKRECDLVLATFGRGIYILDNYSPLRKMNNETINKDALLFPIKDASMFIPSYTLGGGGKSDQGESFYTADNPPIAAVFTYYIKESVKTLKQIRQEKEKELIKKNLPIPFPTPEEILKEDNEPESYLLFTIYDNANHVVRKLKTGIAKGVHRINWDFRSANTTEAQLNSNNDNEGSYYAVPGTYKVSLSKSINGVTSEIVPPQPFVIKPLNANTLNASDIKSLNAFMKEVASLQRVLSAVNSASNELSTTMKLIKNALKITPAQTDTLMSKAIKIENANKEIQIELYGNSSLSNRNENFPSSINNRVSSIVWGLWLTSSAPTQTQKEVYQIASDELTIQLNKLKTLINVDLKKLQNEMDAIGAPYTPGRFPEWK